MAVFPNLHAAIRPGNPMLRPSVFFAGGGRSFLPILMTLYILMILSYGLVWIVDPYTLRTRSSISARLGDFGYADDVVPRLLYVAAKDGTDLVWVGGSTSASFTTAMLREAFPDVKKPVNLSFAGQSL